MTTCANDPIAFYCERTRLILSKTHLALRLVEAWHCKLNSGTLTRCLTSLEYNGQLLPKITRRFTVPARIIAVYVR